MKNAFAQIRKAWGEPTLGSLKTIELVSIVVVNQFDARIAGFCTNEIESYDNSICHLFMEWWEFIYLHLL